MIQFCCGEYSVSARVGELPSVYSDYAEHAVLNEDFGIRAGDGTSLFFSVASNSADWPELVVALRFEPGPQSGFHPGFLLIPERHLNLRSCPRAWCNSVEQSRPPARSSIAL